MKKSLVISLLLGYWCCFAVLLLLFYSLLVNISGPNNAGSYFTLLVTGSIVLPSVISFFGAYSFLFDKYLQPKKFKGLVLGGVAVALGGTIVGELFLTLVFESGFLFRGGWNSMLGASTVILVVALLNVVLGLIIKGFIKWYDDIKIKQQLSDKNHQVEMALVKAKLEPHFLFNTLNNIDVLIQKDPDLASDYLNKLSQIMRYMLYEAKQETVPLQKELEYLNQYINLQKIRTSNPDFVNCTVQTTNNQVQVAPMLFIPFIENAFKHSTNKKAENAINILLKEDGNQIKFVCENHINPHKATPSEGGIGNELIKKRLNLLYPNHQLLISDKDGMYKVQLTIRTNDI